MLLSPDTLQRVIDQYLANGGQAGKIARHVSSVLELVEKVHSEVRCIRRKEEEERKRHDKKMGDIRQELRTIQAGCPHHETQYHPDPAGGRDSHTTCMICGTDL